MIAFFRPLASFRMVRTAAAVCVLIIAFLLTLQAHAAYVVPANDGYMTDAAGILSEQDRASIAQLLQEYDAQTSNQIAVLIVQSLQDEPIADAAVSVFRTWGIGQKDKQNGALLLVSYEDRKMFIMTGYGLEGVLPDIVVKGIIDSEIAPRFRSGDYAGGIREGIVAMEKFIGGEYTQDRYSRESFSGGSGIGFFIVICFLLFQGMMGFLGRTKSWWLGGVIGAVVGVFLTILFAWWWSIVILAVLGLLMDFVASRLYPGMGERKYRRGTWFGGGGFGGGSSSGGGGFGGFGGGSTGGGGAGGSW